METAREGGLAAQQEEQEQRLQPRPLPSHQPMVVCLRLIAKLLDQGTPTPSPLPPPAPEKRCVLCTCTNRTDEGEEEGMRGRSTQQQCVCRYSHCTDHLPWAVTDRDI